MTAALQIRSTAAKRARRTTARMSKARARAISLTLRETAGYVLLALPELPPSANDLYANAASGRVKTAIYRAWRAAAVQDLRFIQRAPLIKGPVKVAYVLERPAKRRRIDCGNFEKALSDALVEAEIIEDDSLIEEINIKWGDVKGVQIAVGKA